MLDAGIDPKFDDFLDTNRVHVHIRRAIEVLLRRSEKEFAEYRVMSAHRAASI